VWLVLLLSSGAAASFARLLGLVASGLPTAYGRTIAVAVFALVAAIGYEVLVFPFVVYRSFVLERKYGLSSEPFAAWARDHLKAAALGTFVVVAAATAISASIAVTPRWWWALSTAIFAFAAVSVAVLAPIVLMPLFYRFSRLERETLRARLLTLSDRAGVRALGAFEWRLGERTRQANAALVGLGRTRRILVSDTLLSAYSDDEIEVILAHEIAHHVHRDIWSSLGFETLVAAAGLLAADVLARHWGHVFAVAGPHDMAALPLMALTIAAASLALAPIRNAWSRYTERRADRFALDLTCRPAAFISAMRRLGAQNLADERPSAAAVWFFHTHPTIEERIVAAKRYESLIPDRESLIGSNP
jgi:STE24 endopeptidase